MIKNDQGDIDELLEMLEAYYTDDSDQVKHATVDVVITCGKIMNG